MHGLEVFEFNKSRSTLGHLESDTDDLSDTAGTKTGVRAASCLTESGNPYAVESEPSRP
jgi:hypothetical protein